jgi:hypothetical protein
VFKEVGGRSFHEGRKEKFIFLFHGVRVVQIHLWTFFKGLEKDFLGLDGGDLLLSELVHVSLAFDNFVESLVEHVGQLGEGFSNDFDLMV